MHSNSDKVVFGEDFGAFLDYLRAPGAPTVISPERFARLLGLDMQTLAESVGAHRNAVTFTSETAKRQQFLRESVQAVRAATNHTGSVENALFWFSTSPLQEFGYKTAYTLVSDGCIEALLGYLASLDAGFAG